MATEAGFCEECNEFSDNLVPCVVCGCLICCGGEDGVGFACWLEIDAGVIDATSAIS